MAEGFYKKARGQDSAISAGIADVGAKYDYTPRENIVLAMREKEIDISGQKVKQVTESMVAESEKIVVLCNPKLLPPFLQKSGLNIVYKQVKDPFRSTMDGVREVRDEIEAIVLELTTNQN